MPAPNRKFSEFSEFNDGHFDGSAHCNSQPDSQKWQLPAIAQPPLPRPRNWPLVWRRLQELIADPERTEKVFELMDAFGGEGDERCFQRFLRSPEAPRLLFERPDLSALLADSEVLAALPAGSLGRRYLAFRDGAGVLASGLVDINSEASPADADLDPERRWFFERLTASHDLWHALTGYGTDEAGESALLAFSVPQIGSRALSLIAIAAAAYGPIRRRFELQRFMWQALQRGRHARFLPAVHWELKLHLPLAAVRQQLAVACPRHAHPEGILVMNHSQWRRSRMTAAP